MLSKAFQNAYGQDSGMAKNKKKSKLIAASRGKAEKQQAMSDHNM